MQVLLIQEVLEIQFHRSDRLSTTATKLWDIVDCIYVIGILKQDDFLLILLMNAMSGEFAPLCNHVTDCINASTMAELYTSSHLLKCLEMEQQLLDSEKQRQSSLALAATIHKLHNHKVQSSKTCSNCGGTGHTVDACWKEGGGRAGQWDTILAEKRATQAARGVKDKPSTMATQLKATSKATRFALRHHWMCIHPR